MQKSQEVIENYLEFESSLQEILVEAKMVCNAIKNYGGKAYVVGGAVRDRVLGLVPKDYDIEAYGLNEEKLIEVLKSTGLKLDLVGKSFGVFKVGNSEEPLDVSLPRVEKKTGPNHKDFEIIPDHTLEPKKALERRDFTINSMLCDFFALQKVDDYESAVRARKEGLLIDPLGGLEDLNRGVIRHSNPNSFTEDSLRVLRAVQFSSRFDFDIAEETQELMQKQHVWDELGQLPTSRLDEELRKMVEKSPNPYKGFLNLVEFDVASSVCPSFKNVPKPKLKKNLFVIRNMRGKIKNPRFKFEIYLSIFLKEVPPTIVKEFLKRFLSKKNEQNRVLALCMNYSWFIESIEEYDRNNDTMVFVKEVKEVMLNLQRKHSLNIDIIRTIADVSQEPLYNRHHVFVDGTIEHAERQDLEPFVNGKTLIELGFKPGEKMGEVLSEIYEKQLMEVLKTKEEALNYAKTLAN